MRSLHFHSASELVKLNVNVEQILRISVDVIQLQDIDPAFRLKVLREGIPLKMKNDMHYALVSQAFSELQDLKIKILVSRFHLSMQLNCEQM